MSRGRRVLLGALVGVLIGGAAAYLLFRPVSSPARNPTSLQPYPLASTPGQPPARPLRARRPAPEFALPSLRGGEIRLSDFRGKVVLLNFFASWCAPCAAEAPDLRATSEKYGGRNVVFVGVAILDEFKEAQAFLERHRLPYPAAFDRGNKIMERYQVTGLPTSIFIDPAGMIVSRFVGPFIGPEGVAELERRLAQAGAQPAAP